MSEPQSKSRATETKPKSGAAAPQVFDPMVAWQQFVSDWEKQINAVSAKVTATEEFSRALNQAAKYQVIAQQQFDRQMDQFLKTLHLPSKSDFDALSERLAKIEDSIERLAIAINRDERPARVALRRTRRPPEATG